MRRGREDTSPCAICNAASYQCIEKDGYRLYRCGECGHLFLYPIPALDELREGYAAENTDFVRNPESTFEHLEKSETTCARAMERLDRVFRQGEAAGSREFLDIGAGAGKLMRRAQGFGWSVRGIEPGPWGQEAAERHHLEILPIMIEDMPSSDLFRGKGYDLITMIDVLEHLQDPVRAMGIVTRFLNPGGSLVLQFPCCDSLGFWSRRRRWPLILLPGHIHYFSRKSFEFLAGRQCLSIDEAITNAHTPVLPRAYIGPIGRVDRILKHLVSQVGLGDMRIVFLSRNSPQEVDVQLQGMP